MTEQLKPGMYLVGREDGGIDPFFVIVEYDGICLSGDESIVPAAQAMTDYMHDAGRWWWRRMTVTHKLPSQEIMDALPPFPVMRGGL